MAKVHKFRLNDRVRLITDEEWDITLHVPAPDTHGIIVCRGHGVDEYSVFWQTGDYSSRVEGDRLEFVSHDAWKELEDWQNCADDEEELF